MLRGKPKIFLWMLILILLITGGVSSVLAQEGSSYLTIQGSSSVPENTQSTFSAYFRGSKVSASWSLSSTQYASISSSGVLTAGSVTSNHTVTVNASYSRDGRSYSAYKAVTITNTGTTSASLTGLTVTGPSSVNSGASASYTATAAFSDNTTRNVTSSASWSVTPAVGTISSGNYSPGTVTTNQTVTIAASYISGGVTKSANTTVTVLAQGTSGNGSYQVFSYNDLGMHCYDSDFSVAAVLPLYNVLRAQVLLKGATPQFMDSTKVNLTYQAIADPKGSINTTSANKTNFWTYVQKLFGVSPAVDTGLKGQKMPGTSNTPQPFASPYDATMKWFGAEGIPITCTDDTSKFNAEPLMRVSAKAASGGATLSNLDTVVPASNEMNCSNCHATGGAAASSSTMSKYGITAWSTSTTPGIQMKQNILILHDAINKTTLVANQPVLCASCHYSKALDLANTGPTGAQVGPKYLSRAMHQHHGLSITGTVPDGNHPPLVTGTTTSACYNCHPGGQTQCLRGAMATAGISCENCHGGMLAVGGYYNMTNGQHRQPWADEPKCQSCHTGDAVSHLGTSIIGTQAYSSSDPAATPIVATNTRFAENANTLYRFSTGGMAGMTCESCHGSTHAEWPTSSANDNVAATQIQGHSGEIVECTACHGTGLSRSLNGPHGMHNVNDSTFWSGGHSSFLGTNGANCKTCHGTDGLGTVLSKAKANRTLGSHTVAAGTPIACNMCHSNYINGGD